MEDREFLESIMEDYFAECDEYLLSIKKNLVRLEAYIGKKEIDKEVLDTVLRNFHTIKGLSAMVGISPAEELSHEMESFIKLLKSQSIVLEEEAFNILKEGVEALEEVILSKKEKREFPDISDISKKIKSLSSKKKKTKAEVKEIPEDVEKKAKEGLDIWNFNFIPSQELSEKGINVEYIKDKLKDIGEIIKVTPEITPNKKMIFRFTVATNKGEESFYYLKDYGVEYELFKGKIKFEEEERIQPSERKPALMTSNFIRVDISKVENLMEILGNLVITRTRFDENLMRFKDILPISVERSLREINHLFERHLKDLREELTNMRLVPIGETFDRMEFVIRDLIRESNKKINLEISGHDTEIDKFIVEKLMDPILHLVRNAVSHGIESEEERVKKGKLPVGKIMLRAFTSGENVIIEVEDDGRGIDSSIVAKKALELGIIKDESEINTTEKLLEVLCSPDFSTREEADRASGRGMGMTVVRDTVRELGGNLSLRTEIDRGTCFTLQIPLTLTIIDVFIITVGDQKYAIPQSYIKEIFDLNEKEISYFENNKIMPYRDRFLPLLYLSEVFKTQEKEKTKNYVLVIERSNKYLGIVVNKILGIREVVVRPLKDPLIKNPEILGATDLGDGKVILIINPERLNKKEVIKNDR